MLLHAKAYIEAGENPGAHKKLQDVTFGLWTVNQMRTEKTT
jgi:hypothetical protein